MPFHRLRNLSSAAIALVAVLSLAGCGRSGRPEYGGCTVEGIDVSRHQGVIDWPAVAGSGVRFAWIKATEGGDYLDPAFTRNWTLAAAAGLRRGAYHFVYWCRPAAEQAKWFVANVPNDPAALPPVLDVEWNPQSRTCPGKVPREKALADVKVMLAAMERAYGVRPILYVPADMFHDVLEGADLDYPLWVRAIGESPELGYGARHWLVLQYNDSGSIAGIATVVDRDCVGGERNTWLERVRIKQ